MANVLLAAFPREKHLAGRRSIGLFQNVSFVSFAASKCRCQRFARSALGAAVGYIPCLLTGVRIWARRERTQDSLHLLSFEMPLSRDTCLRRKHFAQFRTATAWTRSKMNGNNTSVAPVSSTLLASGTLVNRVPHRYFLVSLDTCRVILPCAKAVLIDDKLGCVFIRLTCPTFSDYFWQGGSRYDKAGSFSFFSHLGNTKR